VPRFSLSILPFTGRLIGLALLITLTGGCAPTYRDIQPGTVLQIEGQDSAASAVVERQIDIIPSPAPEPAPPAAYQIGPGDLLSITVYGRPELGSSPSAAADMSGATNAISASGTSNTNSQTSGTRVDENGNLRLPLIGNAAVSGLTVSQAEEVLRKAYRPLVKDPWVTAQVVEYLSRPLYLFGNFNKTGVMYMNRPMTLLQGLALAGGISNSAALRSARLSRKGAVLPVDIYELLSNGDQRQNVWLRPGDAIYLPDKSAEQVFVFGAVSKAGQVPLVNGQLTLAQAIAASTPLSSGYDFKHVRIIRSLSPTRGELIVVDFDKIMRGLARPFMLANGDVIYLPRSQMGTWNDAISEMLPTLQAINGMLQPYVSLKFLLK
jgi:polysaccharide export outer membrane protein